MQRADLRLWLAMAFTLTALAGEGPEQGQWSLEVRTEPSTVDSGAWSGSWSTNHIQAECRFPTAGGFFLAGESQRRGEDSNLYFTGGGFRRLGDWTLAVRAGVGINPIFVRARPRHYCALGRRTADACQRNGNRDFYGRRFFNG